MTIPNLSVILLCYLEGERIQGVVNELLQLLEAAHITYEVVLVANYDPDQPDVTPGLARELARDNPNLIALTEPKTTQHRFGWDVRLGLAKATGEILAIVEGDTQTPLAGIIALYTAMKTSNYDLGKIVRQQRYHDWGRWLLSHGYNLLCRVAWPGLADEDINGKPKLLTRAAYNQLALQSDDWFIDTEIMLQAKRRGWHVLSQPVAWKANQDRPSHVTGATVIEFLKNVARSRFS